MSLIDCSVYVSTKCSGLEKYTLQFLSMKSADCLARRVAESLPRGFSLICARTLVTQSLEWTQVLTTEKQEEALDLLEHPHDSPLLHMLI